MLPTRNKIRISVKFYSDSRGPRQSTFRLDGTPTSLWIHTLAHIPKMPALGLDPRVNVDIGALNCANRKHPICAFFRKGYALVRFPMNWHHSLHVMRGQSSQACADCVHLSAVPRIHRVRTMDCIGRRVYPTSAGLNETASRKHPTCGSRVYPTSAGLNETASRKHPTCGRQAGNDDAEVQEERKWH